MKIRAVRAYASRSRGGSGHNIGRKWRYAIRSLLLSPHWLRRPTQAPRFYFAAQISTTSPLSDSDPPRTLPISRKPLQQSAPYSPGRCAARCSGPNAATAQNSLQNLERQNTVIGNVVTHQLATVKFTVYDQSGCGFQATTHNLFHRSGLLTALLLSRPNDFGNVFLWFPASAGHRSPLRGMRPHYGLRQNEFRHDMLLPLRMYHISL